MRVSQKILLANSSITNVADVSFVELLFVCVQVSIFSDTLLAKNFGRFNFGQKKKCPKIKPSEIFKRPKTLRYSKTTLVSRKKPEMTRKDLEMIGIVKAVTKKLEPEDPFKILFVCY